VLQFADAARSMARCSLDYTGTLRVAVMPSATVPVTLASCSE
jgi:hypothetical protein